MKWFGKKQPSNEEIVILSNSAIACGIIQHPISQRWQTWVSLYGTDITCLTAHKSREDADNVARQIVKAWESGLEDQDQVTAFLGSLPSDGLVDPLPQDVVMRLSRKIRKK
jgi:superfamily I DNA/RNA helicase